MIFFSLHSVLCLVSSTVFYCTSSKLSYITKTFNGLLHSGFKHENMFSKKLQNKLLQIMIRGATVRRKSSFALDCSNCNDRISILYQSINHQLINSLLKINFCRTSQQILCRERSLSSNTHTRTSLWHHHHSAPFKPAQASFTFHFNGSRTQFMAL